MDNNRKTPMAIAKDGNEAAEQVHDIADTAWQKSVEAWKDLSAQGKDAMAGAQKRTEEAWEDAQQLVQKHPGKAVGIALIMGAAIGALLWAFRDTE